MSTYFGQQTGDTDDYWKIQAIFSKRVEYTCPGSGNQIVKELSAYVKVNAGAPNIRLAVYDIGVIDDNLVCQGAAEVAVAGVSYSWQGHLAQADITPNPCTLIGGANYRLGMASDAETTGIYVQVSGASAGDWRYTNADYTGGWPATLSGGTDQTSRAMVRCGVDPITAAISGTATDTIDEVDIRTGGKTIIITLDGTTWIPA